MTEKRFVYYEHKGADYILDTPNKSLDFMEMLGDCLEAEEIVDLLNQLYDENEQLKQALREQLEENGNAYCIEILDKIFDLKYDEWQRKMNETHTYDYIDWENVLNDKGDEE